MIFSRAIISFVLILISFEIFALDQKPSVSVFVLDNNRDTRSVKLSITNQLNQAGFIAKDGNIFLKRLLSSNINNIDSIIENSEILSQMSDSELFIIVKFNYKTINSSSSKISISSEIYNTAAKNFISSWSTPRKIINFSDECDQICKNLLISEKSILLSDQLGKSLNGILNAKSNKIKNYNNLSKVYNFKLSNFRQIDIIHLTDLMINEFPGFIKLSNEENYGKQNSWTYYSSAQLVKLKKWLIISLGEIDLNLDEHYELMISDNNFYIKKFPLFNSKGTKGNISKFN
tara:strand:+ start:172 stop:1038 length:867 start_codon:yes stop_codon:yes gene_type:complete